MQYLYRFETENLGMKNQNEIYATVIQKTKSIRISVFVKWFIFVLYFKKNNYFKTIKSTIK